MGRQPALIKQADLTRLIKGAVNAGVAVGRIEVKPDGSVIIFPGTGQEQVSVNPFDEMLK